MSERESGRTGERENNEISRRTALKVVVAAPIAVGLVWSEPEVMVAQQRTEAALASGDSFQPKFFTPTEWKTVHVLADLIIPRDARSGSATEVGVPEFMDFMMIDVPNNQERMRKGLAWLDEETRRRYGVIFTDATSSEQAALLDELAWPKKAPAELKDGVAFFVSFRNLTLTGFWTTKVGIDDLEYQGNTFHKWEGCPPEALEKLGVSYER